MRKYLALLAAVLGLSLFGLSAANANPNTKDLEPVTFSHASECGLASVRVTVPEQKEAPASYPNWQYGVEISVDGEVHTEHPLQVGPGSAATSLAFEEDQSDGEVVVTYTLLHATENDIIGGFTGDEFTVDTDCEEPVDEEPIDEEPVDEEPVDEEPKDEEPSDNDGSNGNDNGDATNVGSDDGTADEKLPNTGANTGLLGLLAAGLVAGGAGTLIMKRRLE